MGHQHIRTSARQLLCCAITKLSPVSHTHQQLPSFSHSFTRKGGHSCPGASGARRFDEDVETIIRQNKKNNSVCDRDAGYSLSMVNLREWLKDPSELRPDALLSAPSSPLVASNTPRSPLPKFW